MNKKLPIIYLVMLIAPFSGCQTNAKEENNGKGVANTVSLHDNNNKYLPIDKNQSVVSWKGSMQIGTNNHSGYVYISKGELMVENGALTGGTVEINMNTIEDDKHQSDNNLIKHLKDPDFFDVQKFPFSAFAITKVEPVTLVDKQITGNLTIKGITNPVNFPARVELHQGIVKAEGKLVIDRTKWNVRYKSGKFYALLADQVMSDSIEFHIKIVAKK